MTGNLGKLAAAIMSLCVIASCSTYKAAAVRDEITLESLIDPEPLALFEKNQANLTPNIFKIADIGYQGPEQSEVNQLPVFKVNPKGDATMNINKAIAEASKSVSNGRKGGVVVINPGTYYVGELTLKSNVHMRLKPNVVIKADQTNPNQKDVVKIVFNIGGEESIENVSIIGEGKGNERPKIQYFKESERKKGGSRAFRVGGVTNLFIQNVAINDDQTRFSGIAFGLKEGDITASGRATNVTIDNVLQTDACYGYGLVQANVGANMLLTNLLCEGGVAARIETDNRFNPNIRVGVENIRIENIISSKGKAAVFLNPHDLENGKVTVNGSTSFGSQYAIEIVEGRKEGTFSPNVQIKNVHAQYVLETSVHFSGKKYIPLCLLPYFKGEEPDIDKERDGAKKGPSIAVICDSANYSDIDASTVSASVPKNSPPDNTVESRKAIITKPAYRGNDEARQCGENAY